MDKWEMMRNVCDHYGTNIKQVWAARGDRKTVNAKKVICYILRCEGMSLNQIGRFVNKDHRTVLYLIRTIKPEDIRYAGTVKVKKELTPPEEDKQRKILIMNLLNKHHTIEQIVQQTGWCKEYIQDQIDYFIIHGWYKKVPNYKTGGVSLLFFEK